MVILSDLHCGHELGLTPPTWRYQENNPEKGQIARIQREAWESAVHAKKFQSCGDHPIRDRWLREMFDSVETRHEVITRCQHLAPDLGVPAFVRFVETAPAELEEP